MQCICLEAYEQILFREKYGGYIHTKIALDFQVNLEVITRNNIFLKNSLLHNKKVMTP